MLARTITIIILRHSKGLRNLVEACTTAELPESSNGDLSNNPIFVGWLSLTLIVIEVLVNSSYGIHRNNESKQGKKIIIMAGNNFKNHIDSFIH